MLEIGTTYQQLLAVTPKGSVQYFDYRGEGGSKNPKYRLIDLVQNNKFDRHKT